MPRDDEDDEGSDDDQGLEDDELDEDGSGKAYTMRCRMYESQFPEIDDLVMVQVRSIAEMGAYVSLLEYNNIEGMILLSELSRRRIRSINKLIRVGKQEVCMVLRVDKEKGYIDLSKRRVSPEDLQKCDERFQRSKAVHSILRHVSEVKSVDMEGLYRQTAWPLYEKFGHAYEAFRAAITDPDSIFNEELMPGLDPDLRKAMLENIEKRLTPTAVKIRADIEVTCFEYEGINAIKGALLKGVEMGTEDLPIKVKLVAPPLYVMLCSALDKTQGIQLMADAIDTMKSEIKKSKGELQVKVAPRAVDERDDKLLSNLMSTLEEQNREVGGDEEDGDEEDTGMGSANIPGV
uniref:S1 motif domain-containing protein n=1 Tax=Haptolina ericina TaxID=156174 RepID=A0A7S3FG56_9EUKA|mmetsp:Transcript_67301/g.150191  ORF Transcript_67301/g.150191 Transcript_67301/m.150191 type:complete len:348 (+) Transcript_67301:32-1075(+)